MRTLSALGLAALLGCTSAVPSEPGTSEGLVVSPATRPALPLEVYKESSALTLTTTTGDAADVYYPMDAQPSPRLPVVVLLQGAQTDKSEYRTFAELVARHGFVVLVPNHARAFPPGSPPSLFTEQSVITDGLSAARAESERPLSPLAGRVDATRLAVVGHSFGGVAAILGVAGTCAPPFCTPGTYVRPAALKAAVVYGTNYTAGEPRAAIPVDTSAAPVAMLQGTRDGRSLPEWGALTYAELEAPKLQIEIDGANHFGITDSNPPAGAITDPSAATLDQGDSIEKIATSTALFLRWSVNADRAAGDYLRAHHGL